MVIKYCRNCAGNPYTTDLSMQTCPVCHKALAIESIDSIDLEERVKMEAAQVEPPMDAREDEGPITAVPQDDHSYGDFNTDTDVTGARGGAVDKSNGGSTGISSRGGSCGKVIPNTIRGKIAQYSSSGKEDGNYRRLLPHKIYQALVYKQRLEDVLHRFTVRVDQGNDQLGYQRYTDVPVNVHGTISSGLQLVDNAEVEVHGKYRRDGILMADSIYVINNGYRSRVSFQHSVAAIAYGILTVIGAILLIIALTSLDGSFFKSVKSFLAVWGIMAVISTVVYLSFAFSRFGMFSRMVSGRRRGFPLITILIISMILAILFVSIFGSLSGFLSTVSGWIIGLIPAVVVILLLISALKSFF